MEYNYQIISFYSKNMTHSLTVFLRQRDNSILCMYDGIGFFFHFLVSLNYGFAWLRSLFFLTAHIKQCKVYIDRVEKNYKITIIGGHNQKKKIKKRIVHCKHSINAPRCHMHSNTCYI